MKFFKTALLIIFFLSSDLFSTEIEQKNILDQNSIEIIELHHSEEDEIEQHIFINTSNENNELIIDSLNDLEIVKEENEKTDDTYIDEENNNIILEDVNNLLVVEEVQNIEESSKIFAMHGYWEQSIKDDLDFLFQNINLSTSNVLNSYFVESLTEFSKIPQSYSQEEFDYLRIKILIKMGYRKEALRILNNINTYDNYKDYYDRLKLDSYLTNKELSEACSFKDSLQAFSEDKNNIFLKLSIFCSFVEDKTEEADLLNKLLLETSDKDEYFQEIYFNLKNEINDPINLIEGSYDESSFPLYSAMIRIGYLPFTEKFLEFDSTNLTLPIIFSPSTEISLRLKSAHKAYELGLFNAKSLSALYQRVDFSLEELNNWNTTLNNYTNQKEMGMALLFQHANMQFQILPITVLESLKVFWNYAIINDLEKLAYDVSRNLIESTEPSIELSDFSILLARAHIFNKNFQQAEKWISFAENYVSQSSEYDQVGLDNVKFLYNLQKSENQDIFLKYLEDSLINKIKTEGILDGYTETLQTIFSTILNNKEIIDKIEYDKKVIDTRSMPSRYIINNINNSLEKNRIGELILSVLISLDGKSWNDVHPHHLKILLESFKNAKLDNLLRDLIIEIFEESEII